ncbi:T9SS type A sorting domain-containing protein [Rufibacter sediminis]|uniref:T9SS type A sorting domain-containing protein n=1 Tax=Rufibacter sediminis TaxID=2762756 RepID=A0ABR6VX69_9BACT|nr:T9SS type A sorting domain-containing protein [Rufibacter sediminis]MBC3541739.1 T9SS type A sorting domain-containing protein [Rufibacter sediminis]
MKHIYRKTKAPVNWRKALTLGILFLALAFTGLAQGRRETAAGARFRERATMTASSAKAVRAKTSSRTLRTGEYASQPRNAQEFSWNETTNAWGLGYLHAYTFNTAGLLVEDHVTQADNSNFARFVTAYDSHDNLTEDLQYYWEGGAWLLYNGYKEAYTYDNDQLTQAISEFHKNGVWSNSIKRVFNYNPEGHLVDITEYGWDINAWVVEDRTVFEYAAGSNQPASITYQEWDENAWVNSERETDLVWHNFDDVDLSNEDTWQFVTDTYQEWRNNAWVNVMKQTTAYQTSGSFVTVAEEWENGGWRQAYRFSETLNDKGNLTLRVEETWKNGAWVVENGFKYNRTYDSNGHMSEVVFQRWEPASEGSSQGTYVNQDRYVYSNFQVVLASGDELVPSAWRVYPNPTVNSFSVKMEQNSGGTATVVSLTGQTLFTVTLAKTAEEQEINIAHLPSGTYLLQIVSKAGVRSQKIVKL